MVKIMKVLQINSVCGIGSTGKIATDIYDILIEQGHECRIAYGRYEARNIPTEHTIKIGTDLDVKIHALMSRITDRTGFYSRKSTKKFIQEIEAYQPDVIHLHNIHGYFINIEILFGFLERYKKPVIWTLHDCWSFTGHCSYFDYIKCYKWKTQCHNCPQKSAYPKSSLFDNSKKNYMDKRRLFTAVDNMTIVTPSKWLAGLVNESYLGKYPVKVIHNGIDLEIFKPRESDFRNRYHIEDKTIVLGVANIWDERKGFKDFIKLSSMLDNQYVIVLVGLSEQQYADLPENIIGIKRTQNAKELAEIYSTADVFVNPTYEDNFPTVNLEALACGTPVITYDTGGSKECLEKYSGKMIEQGNLEELKKEIRNYKHKNVNSAMDYLKKNESLNKAECFREYIKIYNSKQI